MSAQATFDERRERFSTVIATFGECGPLAIGLVALRGLALGLLFWYGAVTRLHVGAGELAFLALIVLALVVTGAAWCGYGHCFARRAGTDVVNALQWDAVSWGLLAPYPLGLVLPVWIGSPSRMAFVALALWSLAKILIAARFVPTVRGGVLKFR